MGVFSFVRIWGVWGVVFVFSFCLGKFEVLVIWCEWYKMLVGTVGFVFNIV